MIHFTLFWRRATLTFCCTLLTVILFGQTKQINGYITAQEDQRPLKGVSVLIKGTPRGVQTNDEGFYTIAVETGASVVFSYSGYASQQVIATDQEQINIVLILDDQRMEEVVVVGYGTQKKSTLTGSVTSISVKQMEKQTVSNLASAFQGLAPGVDVVQAGGIAGAEAIILIRGAATFGSPAPLYAIDGAFGGSLNMLNPNDIESVEILKDGAAAAIYGSRAANGVVLITTKRGKKGEPVISVNTFYASQRPSKKLDFLNASEYRAFVNQVADNSGLGRAPENDNPSNPNASYDWQKEWLKPAPMYGISLGISGGGEYNAYNVSLGYLDQKGMTAYSGFKRYDLRVNTSYRKNRFSVDQSLSVARLEREPTANITALPPTVPIYDSLGNYISSSKDYYLENATVINPFASLHYSTRRSNATALVGSVNLAYKILEGLEYRITLGGTYTGSNNFTHRPVYYTLYDATGAGISNYGNNANSLNETRGDQFNYNIDNLLSYKTGFNNHHIDVLLGTSWVKDYFRTNSIATIADLGAPNIVATRGTATGQISASEEQFALLSYFGRLNYDFDNRYLLSLSIRNDISSKFAKGFRSGWFPSVSAGWNIHQEKWFQSRSVSLLKLRASYGELGANFIAPYQFVSTLLGPLPSPFGVTPLGAVAAYAAQVFPTNLKWETSISKNIAMELGALNNKFMLTVEYFDRTNNDLLASVPATPSSGQGLTQPVGVGSRLVPINTASIQNKGFEFSLAYNKTAGDFKFQVAANLTALKNKVLKMGENVSPIVGPAMAHNIGDSYTLTSAGAPIGSFYGFEAVGLTDSGTIKIVGYDDNGAKIFKSIEKGGINDKRIIGNPFPDFTYGLNFSANYKSFDFTIFVQGVQGGEIFNHRKLVKYFDYARSLERDVLRAWTPQNTQTDIPMASIKLAAQSGRPSTFFIEDGSYLRLKNVQIGYNVLNNKFLNNKFKQLRIYGGIQNLLTLTKYTGYDPEVSDNTTFTRNVDASEFPNSRMFTIGLNASF